jgi:RND family efflux transporter MFP subunit
MTAGQTEIPRRRVAVFIGLMAVLLGWNIALASRRKYFDGRLVPIVRKDIVLAVRCPSKIEPKVQETVRSALKGKKRLIHVQEGDVVTKGQLLMEISDNEIKRELKTKKINFERAKADAQKAYKDLQLARTLYRKGAVSSREVDDAEQKVVRENQELSTATDDLASTEKKADGVRVFSPLSGVILKIYVQKKSDINENDELFNVAEMNDVIVRARVDEVDIAKVAVGQKAEVECEAFSGQSMSGEVQWIDPQAKEGPFADVEVLVALLDKKGLPLKPNLSCETRIVVGQKPNAVVAPVRSIRRDKKDAYVLKANFAGWLKRQPVTVAEVTEGSAVISQGVQEGDRVLVYQED